MIHGLNSLERSDQLGPSQYKRRAVGVAKLCTEAFRTEWEAIQTELQELAAGTVALGSPIGPVRGLEVLIWSEVEELGYYRSRPDR